MTTTRPHIVILGGGVGGTLTANLLVRKLKKEIARGEAEVTIVDASGVHVYQPGFMYIAMGGERAEGLERPEASLLDKEVNLVIGKVVRVDEAASAVELEDGSRLHYDQLVLATGSRIAPEEIELLLSLRFLGLPDRGIFHAALIKRHRKLAGNRGVERACRVQRRFIVLLHAALQRQRRVQRALGDLDLRAKRHRRTVPPPRGPA